MRPYVGVEGSGGVSGAGHGGMGGVGVVEVQEVEAVLVAAVGGGEGHVVAVGVGELFLRLGEGHEGDSFEEDLACGLDPLFGDGAAGAVVVLDH